MLIAAHFRGRSYELGISEAIARVKDGVRNGGLSGAFAELSAELRGDAIPAALRPAATRLADLLRVPHAQASTPVSLEAFADAHPQGVTSGGVCPFTGMSGSMGELFAALDPAAASHDESVGIAVPALEIAAPALEVAVPVLEEETDGAASALANAEYEALAAAVVTPVQVELPLDVPSMAVPVAAPVSAELLKAAEGELVRKKQPHKKPSARIPVELKKTTGEERAKKAPTSVKPVAAKAAGSEKKAASTPANKTSAKPSAKPLAKRPSAKAGRKKD